MKYLFTLLCTLLLGLAFGQGSIRPADIVEAAHLQGRSFETASLFQSSPTRQFSESSRLVEFQLLDIQTEELRALQRRAPQELSLAIPAGFRGAALELELVQVDITLSEFKVLEASTGQAASVQTGLHYRGIVKGQPNSTVAISLFKDDVMGMIATPEEGNMVLGKLEEDRSEQQYILYPDRDVQSDFDIDCATPDDGEGYTRKDLEPHHIGRDLSDCVRLYFEVDHDIFIDKGGTAGATNYVTGIYNQVATLYANENINTVISEIVVWDVTSPFSSGSSSGMLNDFQAFHNNSSWNGDLGQLLSYQASGGIAAGFNGICNPNRDNSLSFSSIGSSFNIVPTYSWTVMVVTHEFGHLFGSRHTHACVWNGNNTAIDGCSGSTEGSCPLPGNPSIGGTIMSYCHLTSVGINFTQGFGPQPGDVIRNVVDAATCMVPCGPPTCDDGIQNGDETGVDCGGPDCPACPTCFDGIQNGDEVGVDCGGPDCPQCPCNNNLQLILVLDNYPEETTWEVVDQNGGVWFSGGPYGNLPDGSTVTENMCLPDGCFNFIIYDSYGDGICCSYGNGSYQLINTDNNTVLAAGGNFGSSELTPFCLTSPTCDDGIQNGDEEGVDCGGSNCPPCAVVCTENELTLDINFDLLPNQVTWDFQDNQGVVVASGGPYGSDLSLENLQEMICLPNGCYTFNMYDSGNDGLCCRFGNGNFQLIQNATNDVLSSGAVYNSLVSSTFCLDNGSGPTCNDGIQNGDEEGVDCGGSFCPPCSADPTCDDGIQNGDEEGVDCGGSDCPACPTCDDGIQNGDEEGVDCGGSDCPACPTCDDGIQNGDEEGVDCGGSDCPACPTCDDGIQNGDEEGVDCGGSDCPACPTCDDGIQNGDEEDVDCGGTNCPPCVSCSDGVQNGDETGIDCGGSLCPPCYTCDDGIQNGDETGVDCGGSICPICPGTCNFDLTLTLNFDLLPNQTSWQITNELDIVVYEGGPYTNEPGSSTLVIEDLCFDAGCYTLTMFDSGNNGMCCRFGFGSYELTDSNGSVLANGGDFDAEESTLFCLGGQLGLESGVVPIAVPQPSIQSLKVFPNPATDHLAVKFETSGEQVDLYFTSLTGQLMSRHRVNIADGKGAINLSLEDYPAGLYFIHLDNGNGETMSKRFVIMK